LRSTIALVIGLIREGNAAAVQPARVIARILYEVGHMKLPAFQFYPGDWRKDPGLQSLSYHDRGVWMEILCIMFESEQRGKLMLNGKAMPQEALARLLGLDNQILTTTLTTLLTYGVASVDEETGAITCRRMIRDENIRKVRTEAGKKGGNPNLLNQNPTTGVNQIPTPSSSSSSSDNNTLSLPREDRVHEQDSEPGTGPKLDQWLKALTQYSIPEWYSTEKWQAWEAKAWRSGKTPVVWRKVLPWVKRDYEQAGKPTDPAQDRKHAPARSFKQQEREEQEALHKKTSRFGI
jgi:hypothetical protein